MVAGVAAPLIAAVRYLFRLRERDQVAYIARLEKGIASEREIERGIRQHQAERDAHVFAQQAENERLRADIARLQQAIQQKRAQ